jgi:hypothetical protein
MKVLSSMLRTMHFGAAIVAVLAAFVFSASAGAYTFQISDPTGDSGSAPDLTGMTVRFDDQDADALVVKIAYAGSLTSGSDIVVGLDTDLNPATGSDTGADYLITLVPSINGTVAAAFSRWQSSQYVAFTPASPYASAARDGQAEVIFCLCDVGNPLRFGIFVRSEVTGATDTDLMPDAGTATINLPLVRSVLASTSPPRAGAPFAVSIAGVRLWADPTHVLKPQSVTCTASLAGRALAGSRPCRWSLPASARGKKLVLNIKVLYDGTLSRFQQTLSVM